MTILTQFLLRVSFGLAFGMACASPRQVTSGYYRNHLFVVLGMLTLAMMLATGVSQQAGVVGASSNGVAETNSGAAPSPSPSPVKDGGGGEEVEPRVWYRSASFWLPAAGVVVCYVGTILWMLQRTTGGMATLWIASGLALAATYVAQPVEASGFVGVLEWLTPATSGLVLGLPLASMLLGHWYLNSPTMELAPLKRLLLVLFAVLAVRMVVSGIGLAVVFSNNTEPDFYILAFLALRWLFGLLGMVALTWMAWQTMKIPNTQSATGILYVAVIGSFAGELASLLLSELLGSPV